jgi:hypothetical protein
LPPLKPKPLGLEAAFYPKPQQTKLEPMPIYDISIYLAGGAVAKITDEAGSVGQVENALFGQLREPDEDFRIASNKAVIWVKKSQVIGYSVDET